MILASLKTIWRILNRQAKVKLIISGTTSLISSVLEMIGIASTLPIVWLLVNPLVSVYKCTHG